MVYILKKYNVLVYSLLALFMLSLGCSKEEMVPDTPGKETINYFVSSLDTSLYHLEDEYGAIFIENVSFAIDSSQYEALDEISFQILPKEESSLVEDFIVSYSKPYIDNKCFLDRDKMQIILPVFGLYDAYNNTVLINVVFSNGQTWEKTIRIETKQYQYTDPDNWTKTSASSEYTGNSYLYLQTNYGAMIADIEGNIRWAAEEFLSKTPTPSVFFENCFYCKLAGSPYNKVLKLGFDGSQDTIFVDFGDYPGVGIHHEMNVGPKGLLLELNIKNGSSFVKKSSVLVEIDTLGTVLETWDMDDIIGECLAEAGVPVDTFIRNASNSNVAQDWFHMNSAMYDETDNTVLISSRENFVIKVGYADKSIKWILGDTTKFWYSIDPLREYALDLTEGNINIGQHSLSYLDSGELLLFNNGDNSSVSYFPEDKLGATYAKSMVSAYAIFESQNEATEVVNFELPYWCANLGCVQKSGNGYIVNYQPGETEFNSVVAIYDEHKNSVIEFFNYSYFSDRAYGFSHHLNF